MDGGGAPAGGAAGPRPGDRRGREHRAEIAKPARRIAADLAECAKYGDVGITWYGHVALEDVQELVRAALAGDTEETADAAS